MASKREQIVQYIVARLTDTARIEGRVYRSQADPNDRELHPFLAVRWVSEQSSPDTVPQLERQLMVEVAAYTRDDVPDAAADEIMVSAHALLMADTNLGGLAIDIRLEDASTEIVAADMPAAKTTHQYSVKFRHSYTDMTT
jgi:hypothetical protein